MQRISAWTDLVTALGLFRIGTTAGGVPPTPVKVEWLNMIQEELASFILAYLPELDANDNTQLLKAIRAFGASFPLKTTTLAGYGILDAYTKLETYSQPQADWLLSKKANNAISLAGYGILDSYTKTVIDGFLAAINESLAAKQAALNELQTSKQDKHTALMAPTGWRLDRNSGFLEQWGSGSCGPDSTTAAINFPTPFAEVYNCFGNKVTPNSEDSDGNSAGARAINATQYQLFNDTQSFSATIHWRAIGKAPGF
ncbi:phage tail protein [Pseudomonas sp. FSL R10-0765]|uniref:gp53-like domain-containing protein n=1 Tax=Pseudomonas sp. FSL R10-0765 TaxID=2662195 RepID=UPI001295A4B2|nr:phage tail protein [Pseudomonas sp. FSL R10-0765]MQT42932.1 phage tail protein [Pseudomonas sp. FSL R10-0765]